MGLSVGLRVSSDSTDPRARARPVMKACIPEVSRRTVTDSVGMCVGERFFVRPTTSCWWSWRRRGWPGGDSRPTPRSVTTPEAFYEVLARAALDAIGLRAILEDLARADKELNIIADEASTQAENDDATTMLPDEPPVSPQHELTAPLATLRDTESRARARNAEGQKARYRCEWAASAEERLAVVTAAVERLRKVFEMVWSAPAGWPEREMPFDTSAEIESEVITNCSSLIEWLSSTRIPKGLAKAERELAAAAGVYLDAAVAYRSLVDADEYQRQARSNACATLLEQGDHHVETFAAALAKKLRDDGAVDGRSTRESETPGVGRSLSPEEACAFSSLSITP